MAIYPQSNARIGYTIGKSSSRLARLFFPIKLQIISERRESVPDQAKDLDLPVACCLDSSLVDPLKTALKKWQSNIGRLFYGIICIQREDFHAFFVSLNNFGRFDTIDFGLDCFYSKKDSCLI